jgi:hypothetical protein
MYDVFSTLFTMYLYCVPCAKYNVPSAAFAAVGYTSILVSGIDLFFLWEYKLKFRCLTAHCTYCTLHGDPVTYGLGATLCSMPYTPYTPYTHYTRYTPYALYALYTPYAI